jgi:hypothetical protein
MRDAGRPAGRIADAAPLAGQAVKIQTQFTAGSTRLIAKSLDKVEHIENIPLSSGTKAR